ncbi:hypothetical protein L1987_13686 [Smallanthus sonchifolius]|uniref:Uncharacterized protein n=1 Tax=Smallanthus sonchifolius TaxID=185202 RepID=A0ACB9JH84_9ASTR|nr:hypothetical protein L1987_13686 [Smallanthus sonchifolius]
MAKVLWIEDEERFDQRHSAHPKCMSHVVNKIRKLERKDQCSSKKPVGRFREVIHASKKLKTCCLKASS